MIGSALIYLLARICCTYSKFVAAHLLANVSYKIYSLTDISHPEFTSFRLLYFLNIIQISTTDLHFNNIGH